MRRSATSAAAVLIGLLVSSCATSPTEGSEPASGPSTRTPELTQPASESPAAEAQTADQWDPDGDWNREWDENRPDELKAHDVYYSADGTSYTHAEMKAKREDPEPSFDSMPVEDIAAEDLPITEGRGSDPTEPAYSVEPITCTDADALAANEEHDPAGWPVGVAEGEDLPDPECHPDFIELPTWEHYHSTCMNPTAHGAALPPEPPLGAVSEEQFRSAAWAGSEVQSWWTPPAEGESCQGHEG